VKGTFIDLFSGCGGLSLGLRDAGFEELFAVEANADAFETYRRNLHVDGKPKQWPDWLDYKENDVVKLAIERRKELIALRGAVDLIAGGPPCQGFSMNGRRDPSDRRNRLVSAYLSVVRAVRPKVVLMENVRGFRSMKRVSGETHEAFVVSRLQAMGYEVHAELINAADFGVPQRRMRFVLIAFKSGSLPGVLPHLRLAASRKAHLRSLGLPTDRPITVGEAISDLCTVGKKLQDYTASRPVGFQQIVYHPPEVLNPYLKLMRRGSCGGLTNLRLPRHSEATIERMASILSNCEPGKGVEKETMEAFGLKKRTVVKLSNELPAPTVGTLPDDMVHPTEPRILTVRENARLQSFPDWFDFTGPYTSGGIRRRLACPRYTQVGNAVPPLLARALGNTVLSLLRDMGGNLLDDQAAIDQVLLKVGTKHGKVINAEPSIAAE